MHEKHKANQKNRENKTKQKINYKGEEFRKNGRESLEVSPQTRDQSNKDPLKEQSS